MVRLSMLKQQWIERLQNIGRAHLRADMYTQGFARVLVQHGEHLVGPAGAELVVDEIDAPDVVGVVRPEPDD